MLIELVVDLEVFKRIGEDKALLCCIYIKELTSDIVESEIMPQKTHEHDVQLRKYSIRLCGVLRIAIHFFLSF